MAGEDRGNGCFQFRSANAYLLLAVCVALSPACEKKAPSSPMIAVPTFTRSFKADGHEYRYTVVGKDPDQGGTTTIPTVLAPVTLVFDAPADEPGKKVETSAADEFGLSAETRGILLAGFGFAGMLAGRPVGPELLLTRRDLQHQGLRLFRGR